MQNESILIVDDSTLNCEVIKSNLVAAGYAVHVATNGPDAIALFKEKSPDLVMLDIVMPGMNGFEACAGIRALPQGADVPIVFLSALKDLESHQKALDAGGDDVLTKPVHRSELILRARSMIWLKRLRSELRSGYNLISSQRDALLRAQAQKQELIDLIVHDLKSPLQVVTGYLQQLEMHPDVSGNPKLRDMIQKVGGSADLMQRMVINMLDISLSENGTLKPNVATVDVVKLAKDSVEAMQLRSRQRGVSLRLQVQGESLMTQADASLLRRILDNLLDNALRYSPKGSTVTIEVKEDVSEGFTLIGVKDQGGGIPKDERENIFDKTWRTGDKTRSSFNYGLGLTFCQLATQAHGGKIWIEDNEPAGTIFWVAIPLDAAPMDATPIVMA